MNDRAPERAGAARFRISEDWAATIVGLVLLAASLVGLIPAGLVP
ncbi:hypothetical protein [Thermobifida cellulosilytica]|nr:hypothetical protein [Thermobifida cellulosilytica]